MTNDGRRRKLLLRITPRSPLLLGDRSGISNFQETTDFIPGSALRGAVAARLLASCPHPAKAHGHAGCPDGDDCPFWQLFGTDEPHFGNAYPGGLGPVYPFPLTARTCKRYAGLTTGTVAHDAKHHGVIDTLFADFAYDVVSDPDFPGRALMQPSLKKAWSSAWAPRLRDHAETCPAEREGRRCGGPLIQADGYYAWDDGVVYVEAPATARATHVGINRARSVAEDELLFTQETLEAGGRRQQHFFASVTMDRDGERETLFLESLEGVHYVGRGRSRGYGEVVISPEADGSFPSLEDRLLDFQDKVALALLPYQQVDERVVTAPEGQLFSLTLRAPAILEEAGRPLRAPTPEMLGLPEGVLLLRAWARPAQVGGWHSAAGLPRRTRPAVQAGSVFLYYAPQSVPEEALLEQLTRLEAEGIGAERPRGYGQVMACAAFHVQKAAQTVTSEGER